MNVGENIQRIRKERKLTLNAFGKKIGVSPSFLSDIENGRSYPSLKKLELIAKVLNMPVSQLFHESLNIAVEDGESYGFNGLATTEGKRLLNLICDFDHWNKDKQSLLISIIENMKD